MMKPFRPLMIDDIPLTVVTPITMPSTVNNDRSLFLTSESSASAKVSFIAQRHNRIEVCSLAGGIDAEEQSDAGGNHDRQRDGPPLDRCRQGREGRNRQRDG